MFFLQKLKLDLAKELSKELGVKILPEDFEYPPQDMEADLALPCFKYAKQLKKAPYVIAKEMSSAWKNKKVSSAKAVGPYVNFNLKRDIAAKNILEELSAQTVKNKQVDIGKGEKIFIEYVSPNSNKPLHLGHLRNAFLGISLANILTACGYRVKKGSLVNDRGIAICKAMLAYKLFGKGDSPKKSGMKSDHFVGKYYVLFEQKAKINPKLKQEAQKLLQKWEEGDKSATVLWQKMQLWAMDGFAETYKRLGVTFDEMDFEHKIYSEGKRLALELERKGVLEKDEKRNLVANLSKCNLPEKVVLRADGTAVYATTDLALAKRRLTKGYSKIVYVVGSEQDLYFKQLFCLLEQAGMLGARNKERTELKHLSYGLVMLPEGRMKSREGNVVDADELLDKMEELLKKEIKARHDFIDDDEAEKRSSAIALSAIKFYLLSVGPQSTIHFNPKESLSFTGKTGPYLLYSYARLNSILKKAGRKNNEKILNYSSVKHNEVWRLFYLVSQFSEVLTISASLYNPEKLALYLYELSLAVSNFYHKIRILESEPKQKKLYLALAGAVMKILQKGFYCLGFAPLEEM